MIDPEQAEVVKRIYREYLEGSSMDKIAKGLEKDGILTGAGKKKWWTSTINKIADEIFRLRELRQKTPSIPPPEMHRFSVSMSCRISLSSKVLPSKFSMRDW